MLLLDFCVMLKKNVELFILVVYSKMELFFLEIIK